MPRAALVFLLLGGSLFAVERLVAPETGAREPLALPASALARLERQAVVELGRLPTTQEMAARARRQLDDEILLREALARGLDRRDAVIARRLARNLRFLEEEPVGGPAEVRRRAGTLGLERGDPVVRRRLVQLMRRALESPGLAREPRDAELEAYRSRDPERFVAPAAVRFSHHFVSRARHGEALEATSRRRLARLRDDPEAAGAGDPFLAAPQQPLQSAHEIAKHFGPRLASAVVALPVGRWSGPFPSAQGLHLVRVEERRPATPLPFQQIRGRLRQAWLEDRAQAALARALDELRADHAVELAASEPRAPGGPRP